MGVSHMKSNLFLKLLIVVTGILLISNTLFVNESKAEVVNEPETDYLDITSPFVLEFDRMIEWNQSITYYSTYHPNSTIAPSNAHHGITLYDITDIGAPALVSFSLEIDSSNRKRLLIKPNPTWGNNKDYRLVITDHIILESGSNGNNIPVNQVLSNFSSGGNIDYTFGTYFLTFEELMSGNRKINTIIQDYTPRKINVTAPKRYVDEIEVIHKRQNLVQGSTTESVTNIDVKVNHGSSTNTTIKWIEVTPKRNGSAIQAPKVIDNLNLLPISGSRVYDFGFTRLPDTSGFDFEVVLYDADDNPLDKRIVKVPYEEATITNYKQKERFTTAGKTYTLYKLLDSPSTLQKLLDENRMDEIKVQVVQN